MISFGEVRQLRQVCEALRADIIRRADERDALKYELDSLKLDLESTIRERRSYFNEMQKKLGRSRYLRPMLLSP